jgi:shikimate kinase
MKRHVALVGFMASGKSTIGRKLARKLGWGFVDTDALVVRAHGPIPVIFAAEGEATFRRYEQAAIGDALATARPCVIALGGGALTVAQNRESLRELAYRVFIKVSPDQVFNRVRRSRELRPVLGRAPTLASIKALYAQRLPDYAAADRIVDASRCGDAVVIEQIVEWLRAQNLGVGCAAS